MKQLHVILDDRQEIELTELSKYCGTSQTNLIKVLIDIGYNAARTQSILRELEPETLSDNYDLMVITDIFDRLYPPVEDLPNYR